MKKRGKIWQDVNVTIALAILMILIFQWWLGDLPLMPQRQSEAAVAQPQVKSALDLASAVKQPRTPSTTVAAQPVNLGNHAFTAHSDRRDIKLLRSAGWESLPCLSALECDETDESYIFVISADNINPDNVRLRLDGALLTILTTRDLGGEIALKRVMLPEPPDLAAPPRCTLTNGLLRISLRKRVAPCAND